METSTAVMIADVVKKDVVYSAECFDQKPLDSNTQLIVEYSVMALEAKYMAPMAPGDWHDTSRTIDGSIDVIKGILNIGSVIFPPAAPVLEFFSGVGSGIQAILGIIPDDRPNPVVEKFKELEKVVHELEKTMDVHFADMQSFLTEHNFNVNIITQATTLTMYMRNCMKHQEQIDVDNFRSEYLKNYPLSAVYNMKSLLDNRQTNPLMKAMDLEKVKTKATFNKWKNIFTSILGQYLFIEAFARGLLDQSDFNQERIIEQWQVLDENLEKWADEYKKDDGYWEVLKNDFDSYIDTHMNLNNSQKAGEIYERLMKYLTHDAFYIVVMDGTGFDLDLPYYCRNQKDQMITSWHMGRCKAFVYRCRRTGEAARKDYETVKDKFQEAASLLHGNMSLGTVLKQELASRATFNRFGFFGLLSSRYNVQAWYINNNAPSSAMGPGHIQQIKLNDQDHWFITGFAST